MLTQRRFKINSKALIIFLILIFSPLLLQPGKAGGSVPSSNSPITIPRSTETPTREKIDYLQWNDALKLNLTNPDLDFRAYLYLKYDGKYLYALFDYPNGTLGEWNGQTIRFILGFISETPLKTFKYVNIMECSGINFVLKEIKSSDGYQAVKKDVFIKGKMSISPDNTETEHIVLEAAIPFVFAYNREINFTAGLEYFNRSYVQIALGWPNIAKTESGWSWSSQYWGEAEFENSAPVHLKTVITPIAPNKFSFYAEFFSWDVIEDLLLEYKPGIVVKTLPLNLYNSSYCWWWSNQTLTDVPGALNLKYRLSASNTYNYSIGDWLYYQLPCLVTVEAPPYISTTFDGKQYPGGNYALYVQKNSEHTIQFSQSSVDVENEGVSEFQHWSFNGVKTSESPLKIKIDDNIYIKAVYLVFYPVTVTTQLESIEIPGSGRYPSGSQFNATAPAIINETTGVRYVFKRWVVNGDTIHTSSGLEVEVNGPLTAVAEYVKQFYLDVQSKVGNVNGSGWYDENSKIKVYALSKTYVHEGEEYVFSEWTGDYSGSELETGAILMDKPKKLIANWKSSKASPPQTSTPKTSQTLLDNPVAFITSTFQNPFISIIVAAVALSGLLIKRRRSRRSKTPEMPSGKPQGPYTPGQQDRWPRGDLGQGEERGGVPQDQSRRVGSFSHIRCKGCGNEWRDDEKEDINEKFVVKQVDSGFHIRCMVCGRESMTG